MSKNGVWIVLLVLLVSFAQAQTISLDPCGETNVYETGNGGNEEYVMENECISLSMRKNNYDPTTQIYDKLNDRYFRLMANQIIEISPNSSTNITTTITSLGLTSDINEGYIRWQKENFVLGYNITGNKIKFVGNITDWSFNTSDGELWLDIRYFKNDGDTLTYIPVIVDGVEMPIVNDTRQAGSNTFIRQKLGRGQEIILDPVYQISYNPTPGRFYQNGNQSATSYSSFDTPTDITVTLTDGNTETKVDIENKGASDDAVVRVDFANVYEDGYAYFLKIYQRRDTTTAVRVYPHDSNTTINNTYYATLALNGKGYFLVDVTNITVSMENYSTLSYRIVENGTLDKIELSEVSLIKEVNDNATPIISSCFASNTNATCDQNINFSCVVTDDTGINYVTFSGNINGGVNQTYLPYKNNNIYNFNFAHSGVGNYTYNWTRVFAQDVFLNEAVFYPDIVATYTCEASCVEDWVVSYNNQTSCQTNNTFSAQKIYVDNNSCGTTFDLPLDNGSLTENYCNYCDPDWEMHTGGIHDCQLNGTKYIDYFDNNFCYAVTGLSEDAPPFDIDTWVSCQYYQTDFNCSISERPYLKEKMEYDCVLPFGDWKCINRVTYGLTDVQQVNPQKKEKVQGGLININSVLESRESFDSNYGLLNAYFTNKNLVAETPFTITTICSDNNNTITHQQRITPTLKNLDQTNTWLLWGKDNAVYLVVLFLLLALAALFVGTLINNARKG